MRISDWSSDVCSSDLNVQVSAGQLGGLPTRKGVQFSATVLGKTRLQTPEQFENILLKVNTDGSQVRLRNVAKVELGSENYAIQATYSDGKEQPDRKSTRLNSSH